MGCKKAQGFLERTDAQVAAQTDASRERKGRDEALALARGADRVIAVRGKKVVIFDMREAPPDDATLLTHLLGPTGNLRAPTLRKGKTLLVGFSADVYRQVLE
jgi:hypothetical protein